MADSVLVSCSEEIDNCLCILCFRVIEKAHERYLVSGKSKFNAKEAIQQLPFVVSDSSAYICRQCLDKLRKRSSLLTQERKIVTDLTSVYQKGRLKRQQDATVEGPATKRSNISNEAFETTSGKTSHAFDIFSSSSPSPVPISHSTPVKEHQTAKTSVNVRVVWPSKTVEKNLHPELESLGKMLVRGTYKQIANAAWNSKQIRRHLTVNILKEIEKECSNLCSKKNPSCLRSPSKEKMLDFSFEKEIEELQKRAPLFYSVLAIAGSNRNKTEKSSWIPAVGMAASVLLRNRSPYMNAVQLMLGIFLYHSNWAVSNI